jgi:phosphoglycerate dehydrogenase-like enzyme
VRIVATAEVPAIGREAFASLGEIVVERGDGAGVLAEADVLIVRGGRVDAEFLARAPRLRAIARSGAGYDNLDVAEATRRGIPIVYAPGQGSQPVAEGTIALMLAAAKRLGELGRVVVEGRWESRYRISGLDIDGSCAGVIGLGAIGRRVADLCRGLGMDTIACDPGLDRSDEPLVPLVALDELLERSDVISLHCGLSDETRGLVDRRLLARVKPGAVLVNVARGQIIESEDVLAEPLGATGPGTPAVLGSTGGLHAACGRAHPALERGGLRCPGRRDRRRTRGRVTAQRAEPRGGGSANESPVGDLSRATGRRGV